VVKGIRRLLITTCLLRVIYFAAVVDRYILKKTTKLRSSLVLLSYLKRGGQFYSHADVNTRET